MRLLGSDLEYSPALLLASALIYLGLISYLFYFAYENTYGGYYFAICAIFILLMGAMSYTIGTLLLLGINIEKIFTKLAAINTEKLSFLRRYYNGNPLLIIAWLFYFPTMIYFIIPALAYEAQYINVSELVGWVILFVLILAVTFIWVISATTASLKSNEYKGSSYFFEGLYSLIGDVGGPEVTKWLKDVFGNDFVVGLMFFSLIGIGMSIFTWLLVIVRPSFVALWFFAFAALLFALGFGMFAYEYRAIVNSFEVIVTSPNEQQPLLEKTVIESGESEETKIAESGEGQDAKIEI